MLSSADVLRKKKEFFEKIYIDRKVVQEASAEIYFGTRVKKKQTVTGHQSGFEKIRFQTTIIQEIRSEQITDILEIEYIIFYNGEFDPGSG